MNENPNEALYSSFLSLKKSLVYILSSSIIVGVFALGVARNIPGMYEAHFSYVISMDRSEADGEFRYDGYYALSAIELFSATLAGIANSPETIASAYDMANIRLPSQEAVSLTRAIRSENTAPQLVRFTVRDASRDAAEKLAVGLTTVMSDAIDAYNTNGTSAVVFRGTFTEPWISHNTVAPLPIAVSLFALVFVGGIVAVLFQEAIKRGSS